MRDSATRCYWTLEDDLACYRIVRGADALEVYDRGVLFRNVRTWQLGVGGVVISKQPLEVSAGDAVTEPESPVWSGIRRMIEALVVRELAGAEHLTDAQRKFLGIRVRSLAQSTPDRSAWREVRLLTDPSGKHVPLSSLRRYTRFVHVREPGTLRAAHGSDGTFVVTDALLDRFGVGSLRDWLALMADAGGLLPDEYFVESDSLERLLARIPANEEFSGSLA